MSDSRAPRNVDSLSRLVERFGAIPTIVGVTGLAILIAAVLSYVGYLLMNVDIHADPFALVLATLVTAVVAVPTAHYVIRIIGHLNRTESRLRKREQELLREVYERTQAEAEVNRERLRAIEADRSKSRFLSNMSHEIRTPLNSILGFSEIIANERHEAETYSEYSGYIHEAATHLLSLVNDVLDLARVEAGKLDLNPVVLDTRTAIDAKLHMVETEARKKGITLDTNYPAEDLPLLADERAFTQIMLNLLANAIKFSPEGGIVRVAARPDGERAVLISVADAGPGIPEDQLARVLEPFEQSGAGQAHAQAGTGLGLALVKALIELHGGTIRLESELGKGTAAILRFPR